MCYGMGCYYEDSRGECRKPRHEICPEEHPDADSWFDAMSDILYEQRREAALEEQAQ